MGRTMAIASLVILGMGLNLGPALALGGPDLGSGGPAMVQGPGYRTSPLALPGTTVTVSETPTGAALTFTAPASEVAEVRARVRAMEARHNGKAEPPGRGMRHQMMPPSRAVYEEVPDGARLRFEPLAPTRVEELREAVRDHADWMRSRPWAGDG